MGRYNMNEEGRFPYLIRVDGKIAGFALICPHCNYRKEDDARCIGEFFVMLKYRRKGIGLKVATQLFDMIQDFGKFAIGETIFWQVSFGKESLKNTRTTITKFAEQKMICR